MNECQVGTLGYRELPTNWRWVRLGEVCEINPRRPSGFARPDDAPTTFIPMPAIDGLIGSIASPEIKTFSEVKKGYTYFADGDVLFAKITPCMQNGKHAIASGLLDGVGFGSTEFHVIRPSKVITKDWVHRYIRQPSVLMAAIAHFAGSVGQQRVPPGFLANLSIPLPPLPEQKRIAAMLNEQMAALDCARAAAEVQLEVARMLPSTYLRSVFNSPEAKEWPKKQFGEMVDNFDGMRIPIKLDVRTKKKGTYPYYGASGIIDYIDEYIFDGNFLLIGEDGANLIYRSSPIAFRASGKFWVNNHAHVVQPKGDIPLDYLLYFLSITDLKPYVTGAAQPKLTQKDMNSIPVPFPPIAEQQRIVRVTNNQMCKLNKAQEKLKDQIDAIDKLPSALLRRAFNGEI